MASWTDGAAYAPIERPDGFATPEVDPLEVAVPEVAQTPGPMPTPNGFTPTGPTTPLTAVGTAARPGRNPSAPFQVSSGLLTAASSMGRTVTRDPRAPFQSYTATSDVDALPPPTGAPLPPPSGLPQAPIPGAPVGVLASRTSGLAGLSPQERSSQRTLVFLAVALTVLGFTIPSGAPLMLFVAGSLTWRTKRVTGTAGYWCMGTGLVLLAFGGVAPPDVAAILGRLASITFLLWFGLSAYRRAR